MNIKELVASIEIELEAAEQRELRASKEMELILATAQQESRSELSPEEDNRYDALLDARDLARSQQSGIKKKLARARQVQSDEADFDERINDATTPAGLPKRDGNARRTASLSVVREERTYHGGNDPSGTVFLGDVVRAFASNDARSVGRLQNHMREEQVERSSQGYELRASSVGTGAFSGLTVPQYLVDMVAPAVANLRPFADICNKHPLPAQGMSLNISRITTASSDALQASENAAVSGTAMADALLTINVQTAAGQQTISRQAIERGTGIEDVVLQDLFRQYATTLDSTLINQATNGLSAVAGATHTYVDAAPTASALYPKVLGAASSSETATLGMAHPTHAVMHPRRWYWMQSQLTSSWPFIQQPGMDPRAAGKNDALPYNEGPQGVLPNGLRVVMDANISTTAGAGTEDELFVVPNTECHLWEDQGAPVYIRAEQPAAGSLGVLLVVYGYFAYTFARYTAAAQKVTGTGLIAPTF